MLLKTQWVNNEIKEEIKKHLEKNDNENKTTQNLWDASKADLRRKFIAIQVFLETKPNVRRRKEIIKVREETNKIEITKIMEKMNKTTSWFFERVNKSDKPLARLTKKKSKRTQTKIRNEKDDITTDTAGNKKQHKEIL